MTRNPRNTVKMVFAGGLLALSSVMPMVAAGLAYNASAGHAAPATSAPVPMQFMSPAPARG